MFSPSIQKIIDLFSKFPTIGPRTASRFAFYIIKQTKEETGELVKAINNLKENIKTCSFCFNPYENGGTETLCPICQNALRDRKILCIVEKENDLIAIENTKRYKGLYFILGGTVSSLKKEEIDKLKISDLERRIKNPSNFILNSPALEEIIIALNPTSYGESTALFLERKIKEFAMPDLKLTRLGRGLPTGGEVEYADDETIASAFESRH